jgi:uncharacterized protein
LRINKKKIINDPLFGFFNLQSEIVFDLIEHPFFQRLRRIKQLGLTYLVFPGANHTRFEHALGAASLMRQAIFSLRNKGHTITEEEAEAATIAILLHDIGHGPFSHVLENSLVDLSHEDLSILFMEELNRIIGGKINRALQIFKNEYPKKFLCQLVSGQLDMDRLDYLARDSFFTGVTEGHIGVDRIIKMLTIRNDHLVVEIKGIYSIEKFLIARRLMYWQVYLHKTVVSADFLLIQILKRARELTSGGEKLFASPSFRIFLEKQYRLADFRNTLLIEGASLLTHFSLLDDNDLMTSIKVWQNHPDPVLSFLSRNLINRNLFRVLTSNQAFDPEQIARLEEKIKTHFNLPDHTVHYYYTHQELTNSAYRLGNENIKFLLKNGKIMDFMEASDLNLSSLSRLVRKYYLCFPKELDFI